MRKDKTAKYVPRLTGRVVEPAYGFCRVASGVWMDAAIIGGTFNCAELVNCAAVKTTFVRVSFRKAKLDLADLDRVSFCGCSFRGAEIRVGQAQRVEFLGCNLAGATFVGETVGRMDFVGCRLQNAKLNGACKVTEADHVVS